MFAFLSDLSGRKNVRIVNFGHAGDGNIHVNIMISGADADETRRAEEAVEEVFRKTVEMGGTISGEHGVGISKAPFLEMEVGPLGVAVMKRLKECFDPNGILNPGKIFLDEAAVEPFRVLGEGRRSQGVDRPVREVRHLQDGVHPLPGAEGGDRRRPGEDRPDRGGDGRGGR